MSSSISIFCQAAPKFEAVPINKDYALLKLNSDSTDLSIFVPMDSLFEAAQSLREAAQALQTLHLKAESLQNAPD